MLVYIVFSICILLLGKHKKRYTLLFLGVIAYQLIVVNFPYILLSYNYIFISTLMLFLVGLCVYDWEGWGKKIDWLWFVEITPLIVIKLVEILNIINPNVFFIEAIGMNYFKLDGYFIGGILFVMFCREVGYNPFKYNYESFRKYALSLVVSCIFFFNYI